MHSIIDLQTQPMTSWVAQYPEGEVALLLDADCDERTEVTHGGTVMEADDPCSLAIAEDPQLMTVASWVANEGAPQ